MDQRADPVEPVSIPRGAAKHIALSELPPEIREVARAELQDMKTSQPYLEGQLAEEEVVAMQQYQSRALSMTDLTGKPKAQLADISGSELATYRMEGVVPKGPDLAGPWISFDRVFIRPDGVIVTLFEWDFKVDGGGVSAVKEFMNTSVNGRPAQLMVRRSASGAVVTELQWLTERKMFRLAVADDAPRNKSHGTTWMLRIAEAVK